MPAGVSGGFVSSPATPGTAKVSDGFFARIGARSLEAGLLSDLTFAQGDLWLSLLD
jgi:hypothetical protein